MKYSIKYKHGSLVKSELGNKLKDEDICCVCGEKHYSNKVTTDGKRVCISCFNNDKEKEFV
jgi:formylmethanofuran dehydrogenase subunit E